MTATITICLVKNVVMWINYFLRKGGFISTLSPSAIIGGQTLQYPQHLRAEFGSYVQTHEENQPTNIIKERTVGSISLSTTGNLFRHLHILQLMRRKNSD